MTYRTLTYGGVEKALAGWGIAEEGCVLTLANMEPDTLRVAVPAARCTDGAVWPFEGAIVMRSGRESATGLQDSFTGGVIEFSGKRMLHSVEGRPEFEGVYYNFAGPWYDIQNCAYQQLSAWWLGAEATGEELSSDVLLFAKNVDGVATWVTTKQQILDTLQHVLDQYSAQGMAAPFQVELGNIDVNVILSQYGMQDVKCSEVIEYCLRPSPDARLWFDYTVTPPTAYVTSRANCEALAVAIGDGVRHESLRITPRYDLQARGVVLYFKQTNQIDSVSWLQKTMQKYGPHGANSEADPEGGLRVIVQTVDLQGFAQTNVYGELAAVTVSNDLAFWSLVLPELRSTQVRNFAVLTGMTVVDDDGYAVSLGTYPNALMDGSSICSWMKLVGGAAVSGKRVTITADVRYQLWDTEGTGGSRTATNGHLLEVFPVKRLCWRGIVTNGVTGNYSAVNSAVMGDAVPEGLAEKIYTSLATLQYEGDVSLVEAEISGGVMMGNSLNLTGGRAEWETMNAQIQSIVKDFGSGRTVVKLGPTRFLQAGDLTQLFLINRFRRVYQNPATRVSGQSSAGGSSVGLGRNTAKENTNMGLAQRELMRLLYTQSA